jgi:hypothetical protein
MANYVEEHARWSPFHLKEIESDNEQGRVFR